jgi:signal transduction histidine kinase
VSDVESILRAEARRRGVVLEIELAPEALAITGDRIQVQQVLINLVLNAMDAVADLPDARRAVTVSVTRNVNGAVLAVRDRGHGIGTEQRTMVFEPLFSTKPNGMGLGLSISRTIVEARGGRIQVDSVPGEGSVFQVEFPLAGANSAPSPRPAVPAGSEGLMV